MSKRNRKEWKRFAVSQDGCSGNRAGAAGALTAFESRNCYVKDGVLWAGVGAMPAIELGGVWARLQGLNASDIVDVVWVYDWLSHGTNGWLVRTSGGETVFYGNGGTIAFDRAFVDAKAVLIPVSDGVNELAFVCRDGVYRLGLGGTAQRIDEANPDSAVACYARDRLFYLAAAETIGYSAPIEATDFTPSADDAGAVELGEGGEILQLIPFDGAVCVLRKQSINRLIAVGAARDFRVETVTYSGGELIGGTGAIVGNQLFFAAADGVYRFDGNTCKRATDGLPKQAIGEFVAAADGEHYYLSYRTETGREMLVIDEDGEGYFAFGIQPLGNVRGVAIGVIGQQLYAIQAGAEWIGEGETRYFNAYLPLGNGEEKTVTGVTVYGAGGVGVAIESERLARQASVTAAHGVGRVNLAVKGKEFWCRLTLGKDARIEGIAVDDQPMKGGVGV